MSRGLIITLLLANWVAAGEDAKPTPVKKGRDLKYAARKPAEPPRVAPNPHALPPRDVRTPPSGATGKRLMRYIPSARKPKPSRRPSASLVQQPRGVVPVDLPSSHTAARPSVTPTRPKYTKTKTASLSEACEHLLSAARHLETAGLNSAAKNVRDQAQALFATVLLEKKLADLKKLQAEIAELRKIAGLDSSKQIMLSVKIVDFDAAQMRKLGFDFSTALASKPTSVKVKTKSHSAQQSWAKILKTTAANSLLDALVNQKLAKVLSEPVLITTSSRPASFFSGKEFPIIVPQGKGQVAVEFRPVGIKLNAVAVLKDSGRISVEVAPEISQEDAQHSVTVGGRTVPGFTVARLDLQSEVEVGQTILVGGMRLGKRDLLMSVTPTLVR